MKKQVISLALLMLAIPVLGFAQKPVVVQVDKTADFATFHTYSYELGHPAIFKDVDARIVADIEAQLAALGLTKAASGPGDVVVSYHSISRTDVNLKTFDDKEPAAGTERTPAQTFMVGTLVVDLKAGDTGKLLWRAKADGVLKGDAAAQLKTIDDVVVALFGVYPTRVKK